MGEIYESNFQGKYLGKVDEVHILTNYYSNVDHKLEVKISQLPQSWRKQVLEIISK